MKLLAPALIVLLGTVACGGRVVERTSEQAPPASLSRPTSPLSTSTVTARRPTLRWLGEGARVEICKDRDCKTVLETIDATGNSARPTKDLPTGIVFWRLLGGGASSAVWQMSVGAGDAPSHGGADASWGSTLDLNGDGFGEVLVRSADQRSVAIHYGTPSGLEATPRFTIDAAEGDGAISITDAGDINGDGFSDLVIARAERPTEGASGELTRTLLEVRFGGRDGLKTATTLSSSPAHRHFGFGAVTAIGDVNGDGFADVIVSTGQTNAVYVFHGNATGLAATPSVVLREATEAMYVGTNVASAGDVNGDGFGDVIVQEGPSGNIALHLGSARGLDPKPSVMLGEDGRFGDLMLTATDINGDGYADLVLGGRWGGEAEVHHGGTSGPSAGGAIKLAIKTEDYGGCVLTALGDVDGDGFGDVLALGRTHTSLLRGTAYGLDTSTEPKASGVTDISVYLERPVVGSDLDGDGYADAVVTTETSVLVFKGSKGGLSSTASMTLPRK